MKKTAKITKSKYYFKDKDGYFKPLYAHKYMKDFGSSGRKSFIR